MQAVAPRLAIRIHDAQINDRGRMSINDWLEEDSGSDYRWPATYHWPATSTFCH